MVNLRIFLFEFVRKPIFKKCYHMIVYGLRRAALLTRAKHKVRHNIPSGQDKESRALLSKQKPKLIVEYYGHLNLDAPELFSDLFFWQTSGLAGEDIVLYSQIAVDPFDDKRTQEIRKHNISPLALHYKATVTPDVPVFEPDQTKHDLASKTIIVERNSSEESWLKKQAIEYEEQRAYWRGLFIRHNIKLSVAWYKCNTMHMIMADAAKDVGGVGAIYQRSFESISSPWYLTCTDIFFGHSSLTSQVERESGSTIPYFVITGFLGDHRFDLLRKHSQGVRGSMIRNGAKKIVAYFDEDSSDDDPWRIGHNLMRENYAFLLQKVLDQPDMGLIFKPKIPSSLRIRLGPVAQLLTEAEKTGRCYVYEDGTFRGSYSPAGAALAADIAIHGHLYAGSAGVEAALTGTPTVYLDREGCSVSSFYRLERGRDVVFNNWDDLWSACQEHWKINTGVPGFGDWSPLIKDIDPFRDGRAGERMGTYLNWILEGFKDDLPRETVLADAAERYSKEWGKDKVFSINC